MFAPARLLDPLRLVHGTGNDRYDCPDLVALDGHLDRLRRRLAGLDGRNISRADAYRADVDRLLDRRSWLMLSACEPSSPARAPTAGSASR